MAGGRQLSEEDCALEVWLSGTFVPRDDARISAFDAGLQQVTAGDAAGW